jgi:hypothetical protein
MDIWMSDRRGRLCAAVFAIALLFAARASVAQVVVPPNTSCHVTDGAFTVCPDGSAEWAGVPPRFFPESHAYLYAVEADLSPTLGTPSAPQDTFMLMYDECGRTTPLGPNDYSLVNFSTVELENGVERLQHYVIHVFTDGRIIFIENGEVQHAPSGAIRVAEIEGQRGRAGFGSSPNCATPHVITEFEIKLSLSGANVNGAYSPDPLFWSSDVPVDTTTPPSEPPLPPCPGPGTLTPVTLDPVIAPVATDLKPYQITYGALTLDFQSIAGPTCTVQSNIGRLPVFLDLNRSLPPPPFQIATSTAVASLDFLPAGSVNTSAIPSCDFRSGGISTNCFLNGPPGPGNNIVRWSTPGFQETIFGVNGPSTGPLTYYVNLGEFNTGQTFDRLLQTTETFIHHTLINNLSGISSIGLVQDPPANVLVTAPGGAQTGMKPDGTIVNGIPFSTYFASPDLTAVILVEPALGNYGVQVIGAPGEPFSLSLSVADFTRNVQNPFVQSQAASGTISPGGTFFTLPVAARPSPIRNGFNASTLPRNDDGSSGAVPIGFPIGFFGATFTSLYVNNNGNITFDAPQSQYTPFNLTSTGRVIVAPFFADVDTSSAGDPVKYGAGTVDGHPAFGATYVNVDCYSSNASHAFRDSFQVVLINRDDRALHDVDIEFNYDTIQWEAGQASGGNANCLGGTAARAGFSNGSGLPGTAFELPGSGVRGAFLDSNLSTGLINSSSPGLPRGRYVFEVHAGTPVSDQFDTDGDGIADEIDNCPHIPNHDQHDGDFNGIGDVCQDPRDLHSTAGFLQALASGSTRIEPVSVAITSEPSVLDGLVRIVNFRVSDGLTTSAHDLTQHLVDGLVETGVVAASAAQALITQVLQNTSGRTYFLSEGATGGFFDEDVLIANPNDTTAPVTLTFSKENGEQVVTTRSLPPRSHLTVHVDDVPGLEATAASARIASDAGVPLIVERSMFWDAGYYAGHTGGAVDAASADWFFAEGSQGFFDTFVLVINPNAIATDVTMTFLLENEPPVVKTFPVGASTRLTVYAGDIPGIVNRSFGIAVHATQPIMAERSMYFGSLPGRLWSGGTESAGVTAATTRWFLAEGATGGFFDTFVLVSNPNATPAHVTLQYLLDSGETIEVPKIVGANARLTTNIEAEADTRLHNAAVSTVVSSDIPIIAERSMYWPGVATPWGEGHNSFGVGEAGTRWGLAEGRTGGPHGFHTYILLANPQTTAAAVTVTYLRETGAPIVKTYVVPPTSRFNIDTGTITELQNESFGAVIEVTNSVNIIVERSMYWDANGVFWSGGTNATGTRLP